MLRPKGVKIHYEVELGLVIGKTIRDLRPDDHKGALDAIKCRLNIQLWLSIIFVDFFSPPG